MPRVPDYDAAGETQCTGRLFSIQYLSNTRAHTGDLVRPTHRGPRGQTHPLTTLARPPHPRPRAPQIPRRPRQRESSTPLWLPRAWPVFPRCPGPLQRDSRPAVPGWPPLALLSRRPHRVPAHHMAHHRRASRASHRRLNRPARLPASPPAQPRPRATRSHTRASIETETAQGSLIAPAPSPATPPPAPPARPQLSLCAAVPAARPRWPRRHASAQPLPRARACAAPAAAFPRRPVAEGGRGGGGGGGEL